MQNLDPIFSAEILFFTIHPIFSRTSLLSIHPSEVFAAVEPDFEVG